MAKAAEPTAREEWHLAEAVFLTQFFNMSLVKTEKHDLIGIVRDGEDVQRGLLALLASAASHHLRVVHRQPLVGVDSDAEETRVGLQEKIRRVTEVHLLAAGFSPLP